MRQPHHLAALLAVCGLAASVPAGCNSSGAPAAPSPSVSVSPTFTPSTRASGVPAAQGSMAVTVTNTQGQPIPGAGVQVRGAVTFDGTSDAQGAVTFATLPVDANYTVVATAAGFGVTARPQVAVTASAGTQVTVQISPAASITGKVVDQAGQPIAGAVVSDGALSTLTSGDGSFQLSGVNSGTRDLNVARTGFQPARKAGIVVPPAAAGAAGTIALAPLGRPLQVLIEGSKNPLGGENPAAFFGLLIGELRGAGYVVNVGPGSFPDLGAVDVLVVASPTQSYSAAELSAIRSFVASGRKLVLLGEWAGLSGSSTDAVNGVAANFNLFVGPDLLKDFDAAGQLDAPNPDTGQRAKRADFLLVSRFAPHPLTGGVQALAAYESATVSVLRPATSAADPNAAQVLARAGLQGLQVAQIFNSNYGMLAAALSGTGTVVVSGDASLWADADSDQNGTPNFNERNNKQLALNAFGW